MLRFVVLLLGISSGRVAVAFRQHPQPLSQKLQQRSLNRFQLHASSSRENEIKRKIQQLKRQGRIGNNNNDDVGLPASTSYEDKIREKLGTTKSRLLGFGGTQEEESIRAIQDELDVEEEEDEDEATPRARIGSLPDDDMTVSESIASLSEDVYVPQEMTTGDVSSKKFSFDRSIFREADTEEPEMTEEELLELVTQKLAEKQQAEARQRQAEQLSTMATASSSNSVETETRMPEKTTSGVGGTWQKGDDDEANNDLYKPKSGSWGAFPR